MISFENVRYQRLFIDTLTIAPGVTSIIGPNGSGKSTFLKICAGIAEPDCGSVLVDGRSPSETEIGYVNEFPDRNILFSTVKDELASPLRFRRIACKETDQAVRACGGMMGITRLLNRNMQDLSGGEKILVAIAAACISRPRVLILDECDSHLDADRCAWLDTVLLTSGAEYVIRCTQQMEAAADGDYLIFIEKGRMMHAGTPAAVFPLLAGTPFYPLSWRCLV
ncbi:MAG: energy-coupling factor ABC transporter ATP-binding protein [Methanoregula sp.]|jgi:energy-coupling factor transport system ATP-binding protein